MKTNVTFFERVETALADDQLRSVMSTAPMGFAQRRQQAAAVFPEMEARRDQARQIRAHTLAHLDRYLAQFADAVTALGGHVFWAKDGAEANDYIVKLAQREGVQRVIKSKSMVSEETEINHALEAAAVEVIESDLGEFIIQLAGETPSHIIAPVLHKTRQQVGQLFHEHLGVPYTDDPIALNAVARKHLRELFITADMGITGVNFGVAETGTISLVMNEGNGRLVTTTPRIHVAMMGMERLVPSLDDLSVVLQVLARSATGQKLSVYTNLITGPRRAGEADGPEQFHVVILDNGRSRILGSELAEILYCIRCGACLNSCPVYREIGGHAYGNVYSGPLGAVLTPALLGLAPWHDLPHASTLCGACKEACPVRIDLPHLLLKLRALDYEANGAARWLKTGMKLYGEVAKRPSLFKTAVAASSAATRAISRDDWIRRLPGPLHAWTDHRDFPAFAPKSFRQLWQEREKG